MKNFVLVSNQIHAAIVKAAKAEGLKVNANMLNVNAVEFDGVHSVLIGIGKNKDNFFTGKWKTEQAFKRNVLLPENIAAMVGVIRSW